MFNALTFDKDVAKRAGGIADSRVFYIGDDKTDGAENFRIVGEDFTGRLDGNIYLESLLLGDEIIDAVIDHVLGSKCKLIISACRTLDEVGVCDKKYGVTPIGLAHKFGLLDGAFIAGGTYLDKDDIDLIGQSGAGIILTPSMSMGLGEGIPPIRMMLTLGARVYIGTGMREFNPDGDLEFEKRLIMLAASGALCTRGAVSMEALDEMTR